METRTKKHSLLSVEALEPRIALSTLYVSLYGSDNNPGSLSQPFATINHGVSLLQPGDTLYIRGGTYAESLLSTIPGGTSWSAAVTIAAYPGETVTLLPNAGADSVLYFSAAGEEYIIVQGLIIDATNVNHDAVKITYSSGAGASSHLRLQNDEIKNAHNGSGVLVTNDPSTGMNTDYNEFIHCTIHGNGSNSLEHGLYLNSNHNLIDGCNVYDNGGYGIHFYKDSTGSNSADVSYNVVRNNRVHDNGIFGNRGSSGILFSNGDSNLAYNNIVWNNPRGVVVDFGATNSQILNNTIYNNNLGSAGININWGTNTIVENNISFHNANANYLDNATGTLQDHNLFGIDPLFVNLAVNDFHLQIGSPAIDAGITLSQVPVDLDGLKRPQGLAYCIGAYEFPVNTGLATHLQIAAPSTSSAGSTFNVTVTAQDANNNTAIAYTGAIYWASSDSAAVLPGNYTFTAADGGVHTFAGIILKTDGSQSITATDTLITSLSGQATITVTSGTPIAALFGQVSSSGQVWGAVSNGTTAFINSLWASMSTGVTWADVLMGDFNGDGKTDIVARAAESGDVWVGLSNGSMFQFSRWTTWSASVPWVDVRVGDFNGDGKADLAGRVASTGQWWVAQSTGSSFSNRLWTTWSTGTSWAGVSVRDFNGDGKDDIAGLALANGQWWLAQSTGTTVTNSLWASWSTGVTWVDIQAGDFNGDGKADLTARALQSGQWWTALSTGSSFNTSLWATWSTAVSWVDVKVGDFTGDGKTDIVGRAASLGQWWMGRSTGSSFTSALWATWSTGVTWVDVQVGDFNGDGKADITGRALEIGQWWTGLSTGTSFNTTLWTTWSTGVSWADVRLGKNL